MEEEDNEEEKIPEGMELFPAANGTIIVHARSVCGGFCPIHNPSEHHMRTWPLIWRDDRKIFERQCHHGVGHPDPDTLEYLKVKYGELHAGIEGVHGCDGCCSDARAAN